MTASPSRARLLLLVSCVALGAAMVSPSLASGAAKITQSGLELQITDPSGAPLSLTISISADGREFVIRNGGGISDPLPLGCTRVDTNTVRCNIMGIGSITGIGSIAVKGGNAGDSVVYAGDAPFPISLQAVGGGGNDIVDVKPSLGDTTLCDLGDGNDTCTGGDGATTCTLGRGNDTCTGGASPDTCDLGAGRDVCSTGAERDSCSAGPGRDICRMGPDRDVCRMGGGPDTCVGGGGRDVCTGNGGEDRGKSCERLSGVEFPRMPKSECEVPEGLKCLPPD